MPIVINGDGSGYYYYQNKRHGFSWSYEKYDRGMYYYPVYEGNTLHVLLYDPKEDFLVLAFQDSLLLFYKR